MKEDKNGDKITDRREKRMKLSISHLLSDQRTRELMQAYDLGLEEIRFGVGSVLDRLSEEIALYEKEGLWGKTQAGDIKKASLSAASLEGGERGGCEAEEKPINRKNRPWQKGGLTFHGPFLDLYPASFDSLAAKTARIRFSQCYEAALRLGAEGIVFHTGFVPGIHQRDSWIQRSCRFWEDFLEEREGKGPAVYLENVQDPDPAAILEVLEKTDHPLFKACLDIGHLKCHSSQSPREWIRILGGRIGHVHLHDNDGMSDLHLGIKGEDRELLDLIGQIRAAAPGAGFVLEIGEEGELVRTLEILQQAGVWAGEGENS